jgi:two-component system cell cycle sensor histidine kinase/response regulator CckA
LLEKRVQERTADLEAQTVKLNRIMAALNLAGDGIAIAEPDGRTIFANWALINTIGVHSLEDLIGLRSEEFVRDGKPIFDQKEILQAREGVLSKGTWRGEISLRRPDQVRSDKMMVHIRKLADGGRVAVFTDVTEQRHREEERKRLEQQLEQARRLEALGQLAGGVAHDFNNLLGTILGFAKFIVEDSGEESTQHRYASRIVKAGRQAQSLIGQILSFSQRNDQAPAPVNLGLLIEDNLSILKASIAPNARIEFSNEVPGKTANGLRPQLIQLITNLCINASDALGDKAGIVAVKLANADTSQPGFRKLLEFQTSEDSPQPGVQTWSDDAGTQHAGFGLLDADTAYLTLSVSDNGEGMTSEVLSRAFAPFFTTKGKLGGAGLGLAVVHNIVTHHQGGALISTTPGKGSRFEIFLPLATADENAELIKEGPSSLKADRGSILLVDDSTHFGDMLMTALFRLGYEISACDDPNEALAFIEEDPGAWDLVITDQMMPNMTGTELITKIKALRPELPCIICTAAPSGLSEEAARQAGADGFVTKPLDIGNFSVMVGEIIAR